MGKLEILANKTVVAGAMSAYAFNFLGNKLVQQIRQGYYHLFKIKYKKVTEVEDPDADFPYYVRKD